LRVREEGDYAGAVELEQRCDAGEVGRFGVFRCWAGEGSGGVGLDVDHIGSRAIIRDKGEFLLDPSSLEERGRLAMGSWEIPVCLGLWLEV